MSREPRPGFIGPFTRRQLVAVALALVAVAAFGLVVTAPLGAPTPAPSQVPGGNSFVPVGTPTTGLQPGDRAPELTATIAHETPLHLGGWIVIAAGGGLVLLGLGLATRFRRAPRLAVLGLVVAIAGVPLLLAPDPPSQQVGLVDLQGRPIRLTDFRGKAVWIDFWASWCPPCQEETPVLEATYRKYRDQGLVLLAISVQETSPADVAAYAKTYGLTYPIGFDATAGIFHAYSAYALPTQVFIDRAGIVRNVYRGAVSTELADALVKPILAPLPPG